MRRVLATITTAALAAGALVTSSSSHTATAAVRPPITVGNGHGCGPINGDDCWGLNQDGELGNPNLVGTTGVSAVPETITGLPTNGTVTALDSFDTHTCALVDTAGTTNGWCWGNNRTGQLGSAPNTTPNPTPVALSASSTYTNVDIATGRDHTCMLTTSTEVNCWGSNSNGQATDYTAPSGSLLDLATGGEHNCVIWNTVVQCWGSNSHGQLGVPTPAFTATPINVPLPATAGTPVDIAAGDHHTCAVTDPPGFGNLEIWCWGDNSHGQLGSTTLSPNQPPTSVALPSSPIAVAAGWDHTCWIDIDELVFCRGHNTHAQLGTAPTSTPQPAAAQVQFPTTVFAAAIDGGARNTCILDTNNTTWCWGDNVRGQLGNGLTYPHSATPIVVGSTPPPITPTISTLEPDPTNHQPAEVKVMFNAFVAGFNPSDVEIIVLSGNVTIGNVANFAGLLSDTYTLAINATGTGRISVRIPDNVTTNPSGTIPNVSSNTIELGIDTEPPTGTLTRPNSQPEFTTNTTITAEVTTNEPVIGLDAADFAIVGPATATITSVTGGPTTYTITATAPATTVGMYRIEYVGSATDLATNPATITGTAEVFVVPFNPDIIPITPARLVDTRPGEATVDGTNQGTGRLGAGTTYRFNVLGRGQVPATNVKAVALNVVAVNPTNDGYFTIYPCDEPQPQASGHNHNANTSRANEQLAKTAANGDVCIFALTDTHLVVDVNAYVPADSDITPITPTRLVDTRPGPTQHFTIDGANQNTGLVAAGTTYRFTPLGRGPIPTSDVDGVVINVVAARPSSNGYLTIHPCDEPRPKASSLNYTAGQTISNEQVMPLAANGEICIFTLADTHLVVDAVAHSNTDADIITTTPARLVDTRPGPTQHFTIDGANQNTGRIAAGQTLTFNVLGRNNLPTSSIGVTINVAAVDPAADGFLTISPCGDFPLASSLNYAAGQTISNEVVAQTSRSGQLCIFSLADTDLVVDVTSHITLPRHP